LDVVDSIRPSLDDPGREQIEEALNSILGSADFVASDRKTKFLRYIVEETLSGRAARLKGYDIALAVFERSPSFDAQADPLVRVEAGRLRLALERYYLKGGHGDPVRISIPKGGYVPVFEWVAPAAARGADVAIPPAAPAGRSKTTTRRIRIIGALTAAAILAATTLAVSVDFADGDEAQDQRVTVLGPSLLIQPFATISSDPADQQFSTDLTDEIAAALSRFKTIRIATARSSDRTPFAARTGPRHDYVLQGSIRKVEQSVRVVVQLEDTANRSLLWTRAFDRAESAANALDPRPDIAAQVAMTLGDPYDVLFSNELKKITASGSVASGSYACILRFHGYWLNPTAAEHRALRNCHEQSVDAVPHSADLWADLAWLYLDESRFGYNPADFPVPALERAADAARRAVSLQPDSARAHLAAAIVQWFRRDFRSFDRHAELALLLNGNDATVAAELGLRYGLRGDWGRSRPLIDRAISRDPTRWQTYRVSYAQYAIETGDFARALEELTLTRAVDHPVLKVTRAAVYGHLGRIAEAQEDWRAATRELPQLSYAPRFWIDGRGASLALTRGLMQGLDNAGVFCTE
jgi:adenylate cyclase